jgi:hypothetical protein
MENAKFDYEMWKKSNPTNEELAEFYETFDWKPISQKQGEPPLTGPFLSFPHPNYLKQTKRLLIFGQETSEWVGNGYNPASSRERTLESFAMYSSFIFPFADKINDPKSNSTPFWQVYKGITNHDHRDAVWCNVMPFDGKVNRKGASLVTAHTKTKAFEYAREAAAILVPKLIEILEPTHILFFTGPNYDWILNGVFKNGGISNFPPLVGGFTIPRQNGGEPIETVRSVVIPEFSGTAIRTYHPGYYNRMRCLVNFVEYLKAVI